MNNYAPNPPNTFGYINHHNEVDIATEVDSVDNLFGNYLPNHPNYNSGNYGVPRLSNLHDQDEKKPINDASTVVSDQIAAAAALRQPILTEKQRIKKEKKDAKKLKKKLKKGKKVKIKKSENDDVASGRNLNNDALDEPGMIKKQDTDLLNEIKSVKRKHKKI